MERLAAGNTINTVTVSRTTVSLIPRITAVTQPEAGGSVTLGVFTGVGCKEGSGPLGDCVTFQ